MDECRNFEFSFDELLLKESDISSAMGYRDVVPPSVAKALHEVWDESYGLISAHAGFCIVPVEKNEAVKGELHVQGEILGIKKIIAAALRDISSAAVFTATIGSALEEKAVQYNDKGEMLKMYCADIMGSEAVEKAADRMQEALALYAKGQGMEITNRYSPGYCGWDVAEQKKIFSILPDQFCGVTLTKSAMMMPVKSVSGIIGLGAQVKIMPYGCAICDKANCIRRVKG